MPALQNFCVQAAFAIIFNYIFQLTTFVVVLIMDEERKKSGRLDVLFCIKTDDQLK
jgi:Niemann-Pick C1 protein